MTNGPNEFETAAAAQTRSSIGGEFFSFLKSNGKWWLLPIVLAVALVGALVVASGSAAAPFIYTLF